MGKPDKADDSGIKRTICVILTCFNRGVITEKCIRSFGFDNKRYHYQFVVTDDSSSDDTPARLDNLKKENVDITILHEDGEAYYCGGMRAGIAYAKAHSEAVLFLLINDDVVFNEAAIKRMTERMEQHPEVDVLVGPTSGNDGNLSYGGIRYLRGIRYAMIGPDDRGEVDTFNANCVMIRRDVFLAEDNIDSKYIHTLGDFDYGLALKHHGRHIYMANEYVGICDDNSKIGSWQDPDLGIIERIKAKEQAKGAPLAQWFYFLRKNFGLKYALLHGFTPYFRILLRK